MNYANDTSQAALERSSQDAYDVIRLTRSKAAVWTVDDVARLIEFKKIYIYSGEPVLRPVECCNCCYCPSVSHIFAIMRLGYRKTEPRPYQQAKKLAKFEHTVPEICLRTDRHTDRHVYRNNPLPCQRRTRPNRGYADEEVMKCRSFITLSVQIVREIRRVST